MFKKGRRNLHVNEERSRERVTYVVPSSHRSVRWLANWLTFRLLSGPKMAFRGRYVTFLYCLHFSTLNHPWLFRSIWLRIVSWERVASFTDGICHKWERGALKAYLDEEYYQRGGLILDRRLSDTFVDFIALINSRAISFFCYFL